MEDTFLNGCKDGEIILSDGLDVNCHHGWGLRRAVRYKHKHVWQPLLSHPNLAVNLSNRFGLTALHTAARFNVDQAVEDLLNHPQIEVNLQTKKGCTAVMVAAKYNSFESLKLLIKDKRVELSGTDSQGRCLEELIGRTANENLKHLDDSILNMIKAEMLNRLNLRKKKLTLNAVVDPSKYLEKQAREKINRLLEDMYEVQRMEMEMFQINMENKSKEFEENHKEEMSRYLDHLEEEQRTFREKLEEEKRMFENKQERDFHYFLAGLEMKKIIFFNSQKESRTKFYHQEHVNLIEFKKKQDLERTNLQLREENRSNSQSKPSPVSPSSPALPSRSLGQILPPRRPSLSTGGHFGSHSRQTTPITVQPSLNQSEDRRRSTDQSQTDNRRRPASLSPVPARKLASASKDCWSAQPSRTGSPVQKSTNLLDIDKKVQSDIEKPSLSSDIRTQTVPTNTHPYAFSTPNSATNGNFQILRDIHPSSMANPASVGNDVNSNPAPKQTVRTGFQQVRSGQPDTKPGYIGSFSSTNDQVPVKPVSSTFIQYQTFYNPQTGQIYYLPFQVQAAEDRSRAVTTTPSPLPSLEYIRTADNTTEFKKEERIVGLVKPLISNQSDLQPEVSGGGGGGGGGTVRSAAVTVGPPVTPRLARKHGMAMEVLKEEEEERWISAEDSEILSITNSAVESFHTSESFKSLLGEEFRERDDVWRHSSNSPDTTEDQLTIRENKSRDITVPADMMAGLESSRQQHGISVPDHGVPAFYVAAPDPGSPVDSGSLQFPCTIT